MRRGERFQRVPGVVLGMGLLALLVAGCTAGPGSGQPSDMAPASQQTFHYQLVTGASDISGLDPDVNFDDGDISAHAASALPISLIYSGLVALDDNLAVENWDAQKVDVTPDGLRYTFHLRSGLKFSDGTSVHASDYAFGLNRTLDPCLDSATGGSPVAFYLYPIKDATTFNQETCAPGAGGANNSYGPGTGQSGAVLKTLVGDSIVADDTAATLTITLSAPAAYFLHALAYPEAVAIEAKVVGANATNSSWTKTLSQGATGQGGSGPYYVSAWDHKGSLVLKANPYFWKKPYLRTISISIYPDGATAYKAYQSGKDDIGYPTATDLAQAHTKGDLRQQGVIWVNYLGMNWKQPPFDDVRARQAFALALNKDQLVANVLRGTQTATNHIVPAGMPGYNPNLKGPAGVASTQGDAAKAKGLWQQYVQAKCGGQASGCAAVTLNYSSGNATAGALATAMAAMWSSALGVNVALQPVEFDTLQGQLATQSVQFWMIGWRGTFPDPEDFLSEQFQQGAPYNFGNVAIKDANALMARADTDLNEAERLQEYQQAEQMLVDQVAWVPYDQVTDHWQVKSWIHGYVETALGQPALDQWLGMYVANH
ncbi:MAG TPA: peptide ABC transporter substrate-binding protein [Ktedonobacterales bacterium]